MVLFLDAFLYALQDLILCYIFLDILQNNKKICKRFDEFSHDLLESIAIYTVGYSRGMCKQIFELWFSHEW